MSKAIWLYTWCPSIILIANAFTLRSRLVWIIDYMVSLPIGPFMKYSPATSYTSFPASYSLCSSDSRIFCKQVDKLLLWEIFACSFLPSVIYRLTSSCPWGFTQDCLLDKVFPDHPTLHILLSYCIFFSCFTLSLFNIFYISLIYPGVLVHSGYYNKIPQTRLLISNKNLFLTVLEAGKLRSRQ